MADIKNALNKQVTRGEALTQIVIILIAVLGVAQFTHILAAQPQPSETVKTASVGATGATGAMGDTGPAGANGAPGENGKRGIPGLTGTPGATGTQGLAGAAGIPGIVSSAYGELSASSQRISIEAPNNWVPIPFNTTGPASNMNVSTVSPATITAQKNGVYQINLSVYFSSENSDESIFTPATYTLGIKIGSDSIKPVAATYAGEPGEYFFNYSDITNISTNDAVRFYMSASDAEPDIFSNVVTVENSNAYVMQISN